MTFAAPAPLPTVSDGTARTRLIETAAPIDLVRTMAAFGVGGRDPSLCITPAEVWRASRTPDGPVTLRLRPEPTSACVIRADAWGPGSAWALARAHELVGADDDIDGFTPTHPLIVDLHRHHPGLRFGRSRSIVETMVPTILEQKVTSIEAHRSYHALVQAHGELAPGPLDELGAPPLRLRPEPARLAELAYADFHRFGIERRRAETILRICRRASSLDRLAADDAPADDRDARDAQLAHVRTALESLPGVGPWTSAIVLQQAFGAADAVIVGDYHLPNIVAFNLAGEARATDERMLELLEPFQPHRGRVVRLLALGGRHAPRRAPGRRLRSIASI